MEHFAFSTFFNMRSMLEHHFEEDFGGSKNHLDMLKLILEALLGPHWNSAGGLLGNGNSGGPFSGTPIEDSRFPLKKTPSKGSQKFNEFHMMVRTHKNAQKQT